MVTGGRLNETILNILCVQPAELNELVQSMVQLEKDSRPTLHEVRQRLQSILSTLVAEGHEPRYVKPMYDFFTFRPVQATSSTPVAGACAQTTAASHSAPNTTPAPLPSNSGHSISPHDDAACSVRGNALSNMEVSNLADGIAKLPFHASHHASPSPPLDEGAPQVLRSI
jgi:hypothetical protein